MSKEHHNHNLDKLSGRLLCQLDNSKYGDMLNYYVRVKRLRETLPHRFFLYVFRKSERRLLRQQNQRLRDHPRCLYFADCTFLNSHTGRHRISHGEKSNKRFCKCPYKPKVEIGIPLKTNNLTPNRKIISENNPVAENAAENVAAFPISLYHAA